MKLHWRLIVLTVTALALIAGIVAGPGSARVAQAGGSWSAWLYNQGTGQLVHVFPDGAAPTSMTLPLPPGVTQNPSIVTISRDGSYLAGCFQDGAGNTSVQIFDLYGGGYIAQYNAPGSVPACTLSRFSFSPDNSELAFGLMNRWAGEPSDGRPAWALLIMQTHTSSIVNWIDATSPQITALGRDYSGFVPYVTAYEPAVMAFKMIPYATEGAQEFDSLIWQLGGGTVSMGGPYGKTALDMLPNAGEAIWVDVDNTLPQGVLEGPGFPYNVVMYSNKTGAMYPLFNNGTVLYGATFIDNGRRLAVSSSGGGITQWYTFDRSGSVTSLPADTTNVYQLYGTLDGYAFLMQDGVSAPQVRYHRFNGGPTPDVYTAWTGTPGDYWNIIWVNPLVGETGLTPFPQLATIGTPPSLPTLPPAAVVTPPPPAVANVLMLYGHAVITTTGGDPLRIRTGAGTGFAVAFQLPNGTPVTLMEGPVSADGLIWWRIQAADGRGGWCVEGVMDNGVYLQTLVPAP